MQKKELVKFREYDYEGIERHLEEMAAKGWMLSSAGPIFWTYEECEPRKLKFALSYRKDEKEMEQGEWKQVDTWTHTRIFCSEKEDARPLYEDGKERLQDIRRLVRNNEVGLRFVVAAFAFYYGYQFFKDILEYPLDYLSEYWWVGMSGIITILLILITAQPVRGIIWMCKLDRKIKSGDYSLAMNTAGYIRRKDVFACLAISLWSVSALLLDARF